MSTPAAATPASTLAGSHTGCNDSGRRFSTAPRSELPNASSSGGRVREPSTKAPPQNVAEADGRNSKPIATVPANVASAVSPALIRPVSSR